MNPEIAQITVLLLIGFCTGATFITIFYAWLDDQGYITFMRNQDSFYNFLVKVHGEKEAKKIYKRIERKNMFIKVRRG